MRKRKPAELKDSGIEWIGDIPNAWDVSKLKYLAVIISGQSPASESYNENGDGTPFLQGNADFTDLYPTGDTYTNAGKKYSQRNDILFSVRAPVGELNISDQRYSIGRGLCAIRPMSVDQKFLWYELQLAREDLRSISTGSTFESVSTEDLKNVLTVAPPNEEQCAIATFLDRKTKAIDQLIEKKQQLIEKLKEKRQALITRAVTKGLNPDAPMKDSGIEWLGEIPEHWDVLKTKYLFSLETDKAHKNNDYELLSVYTDIGVEPRKELEAKGNKASTTDGYWIVKEGDIIVNKLLAWMGAIGYSNYEGVTSPAYDILRPRNDVQSKFYGYLFRTKKCQAELKRNSYGIMDMRLRLYFSQFGQIPMPLPSKSEQEEIINFISEFQKKTDKLIIGLNNSIDKIKEYRQSLISAAVTGKIDVRDEVDALAE